jgi:ATP adenylyltransferase
MQNLWAPWRGELLTGEKPPGCVFCTAPRAADAKRALVLYKGTQAFVILNKYPYNNGHIMVVPYRHIADLDDLDPLESAEIFSLLQRGVAVLKGLMNPEGFNLGANLGRVAGAGIEQHLHFHVVPRWNGDTNFMPVLSDTRVISQHLEVTFDRLSAAFNAPAGDSAP